MRRHASFFIFISFLSFLQLGWKFQTHSDLTQAAYKELRTEAKKGKLEYYVKTVIWLPRWEDYGSEWYSLKQVANVPDYYKQRSAEYNVPENMKGLLDGIGGEYKNLIKSHDFQGDGFDKVMNYINAYRKAARKAFKHGMYVETLYFMGIAAHLVEDGCAGVHHIDSDDHRNFEGDAGQFLDAKRVNIVIEPFSEKSVTKTIKETGEAAKNEIKLWKKGNKEAIISKQLSNAATAVYTMFSEITAETLVFSAVNIWPNQKRYDGQFVLPSDKKAMVDLYLKLEGIADKYAFRVFCRKAGESKFIELKDKEIEELDDEVEETGCRTHKIIRSFEPGIYDLKVEVLGKAKIRAVTGRHWYPKS